MTKTLERTMNRIISKFPELRQVAADVANSYVVDDMYGGTFSVQPYDTEKFLLEADLVVPTTEKYAEPTEDVCVAEKYFDKIGVVPSDYHRHETGVHHELHIHLENVVPPDYLKDFITKMYEARAKTADAIQQAERCNNLPT